MIKKDGKTYVVLEFEMDSHAEYFEAQFRGGEDPEKMLDALANAKLGDDAFASEDEVNAIDSIDRLAGKRVR